MSEPDSLYIHARMSPKAYEGFLANPVATTAAFDDWMDWLKDT